MSRLQCHAQERAGVAPYQAPVFFFFFFFFFFAPRMTDKARLVYSRVL